MKKLFFWITLLTLTIGLITYLFHLGEYDFMTQIGKVASLEYTNPISDLQDIIEEAYNLFDLDSVDVAWYEYIVVFFQWVGTMFKVPIILIKDVATNLISNKSNS